MFEQESHTVYFQQRLGNVWITADEGSFSCCQTTCYFTCLLRMISYRAPSIYLDSIHSTIVDSMV